MARYLCLSFSLSVSFLFKGHAAADVRERTLLSDMACAAMTPLRLQQRFGRFAIPWPTGRGRFLNIHLGWLKAPENIARLIHLEHPEENRSISSLTRAYIQRTPWSTVSPCACGRPLSCLNHHLSPRVEKNKSAATLIHAVPEDLALSLVNEAISLVLLTSSSCEEDEGAGCLLLLILTVNDARRLPPASPPGVEAFTTFPWLCCSPPSCCCFEKVPLSVRKKARRGIAPLATSSSKSTCNQSSHAPVIPPSHHHEEGVRAGTLARSRSLGWCGAFFPKSPVGTQRPARGCSVVRRHLAGMNEETSPCFSLNGVGWTELRGVSTKNQG